MDSLQTANENDTDRFDQADLVLTGRFEFTPSINSMFITAARKSPGGKSLAKLQRHLEMPAQVNGYDEVEIVLDLESDKSLRQDETTGDTVELIGRFGVNAYEKRIFLFAECKTEGGESLLELKRSLYRSHVTREDRGDPKFIELILSRG